jgi:hypothetical protein
MMDLMLAAWPLSILLIGAGTICIRHMVNEFACNAYGNEYRIVTYDLKYRIQYRDKLFRWVWHYHKEYKDNSFQNTTKIIKDYDTLKQAQHARDIKVNQEQAKITLRKETKAENKRLSQLKPVVVNEEVEEIIQTLSDEIDDQTNNNNEPRWENGNYAGF